MKADSDQIQDAIRKTIEKFPFDNYMERGIGNSAKYVPGANESISSAILRHLPSGSSILDFGCGPCDKTAILQELGYKCSGFDDLQDDWHLLDNNKEKIKQFASQNGINLHLAEDGPMPFQKETFDMVMSNDVLEHLHNSPRELLNDLTELLKPNGLLLITVPNAGNIRKRFQLLAGGTNMPNYKEFYWHRDNWRGHVREYVRSDLVQLSEFLGLEILELYGCHHMLGVLPEVLRAPYTLTTKILPNWRDSWLLLAKKPQDWKPRRVQP